MNLTLAGITPPDDRRELVKQLAAAVDAAESRSRECLSSSHPMDAFLPST